MEEKMIKKSKKSIKEKDLKKVSGGRVPIVAGKVNPIVAKSVAPPLV